MRIARTFVLLALFSILLPAAAMAAPPSPDVLERMSADPELATQISSVLEEARAFGVDKPAAPSIVRGKSALGVPTFYYGGTPVTSGDVRTLVLLVDFDDAPAETTATFFDDLFFADAFGPTSMRGYFREVSYGTPDAHGLLNVVTYNQPSVLGWIRMPQPYSYYVGGEYGLASIEETGNAQRMVEDAIAAVDHAVDFSLYDNNGDGYVENLIVVHAGQGAEITAGVAGPDLAQGPGDMDIWSHAWWVSPILADGVLVSRYSTDPEYLHTAGDMTVGTPAHEFGHTMGLLDLYDRDHSSQGVGMWSLMGSGNWNSATATDTPGSSPARLDPWSSQRLGWLEPQLADGVPSERVIPAAASSPSQSTWKVHPGAGKEYWLVENRQRTGTDKGLPGSGLLVWHINESRLDEETWLAGESYNTSDTCRLVDVEEAHGGFQSMDSSVSSAPDLVNRGDAQDTFPVAPDKREFTDFTDPNGRTHYGGVSHVIIDQISDSGPAMTALMGLNVDRVAINKGADITNEWTVSMSTYVFRARTMSINVGNGFEPEVEYDETYPILLPFGDGTKSVSVACFDESGSVICTLTDTIDLDSTVPTVGAVVSPTNPDPMAWYNLAPTFTWSASDNVGVTGYSIVVDAAMSTMPDWTDEGIGNSTSVPEIADGLYTFHVRVNDRAGNWSLPSRMEFRVDRTPPTSTAIPTGRYVSPALVSIDAIDAHAGIDKTYYSLDGAEMKVYTGEFPVSGTGIHTVDYYSTDMAGNVEAVRSVTFGVSQNQSPEHPVAGPDRFSTAVEASKLGYPDGAETVVLVTGRNWPDALGASALAGASDAPILLTDTSIIPSVVVEEIDRLGATEVIIVGGSLAIDDDVEFVLRDIGAVTTVRRLAGMNRYETARLCAAETILLKGDDYDGTVLVATGGSFADALAVSPIAAANGWPVLLAPPGGGLMQEDIDLVEVFGSRGVILGGRSAVSYDVYIDLFKCFGTDGVSLIAGPDRYATAALIARWGVESCGMNWQSPALAAGTMPYDALAGGVAQGVDRAVMLLTKPAELPEPTGECIAENEPEILGVRFLGGTGAISTTVRHQVAEYFK